MYLSTCLDRSEDHVELRKLPLGQAPPQAVEALTDCRLHPTPSSAAADDDSTSSSAAGDDDPTPSAAAADDEESTPSSAAADDDPTPSSAAADDESTPSSADPTPSSALDVTKFE
eukprot:3868769-Amphidinium_carterae.1